MYILHDRYIIYTIDHPTAYEWVIWLVGRKTGLFVVLQRRNIVTISNVRYDRKD